MKRKGNTHSTLEKNLSKEELRERTGIKKNRKTKIQVNYTASKGLPVRKKADKEEKGVAEMMSLLSVDLNGKKKEALVSPDCV